MSKGSTLGSLNIPVVFSTANHKILLCHIKRSQKTVVAWFKFPVEEGIKEHWWEISAPPTNPLFMEDLPLILASIWSDESIWSQQLHPQPHLFVCWVWGWLFFYFFFNTHCITITTVVQTESGHVWTQPLLSTLTSLWQCSSPLPISHCHSCSFLITLNTYSFVVTSDALRSWAQYFSMRATALSFRHKSFACNWDEVSSCKRLEFLEEQCKTREWNPSGQKSHHKSHQVLIQVQNSYFLPHAALKAPLRQSSALYTQSSLEEEGTNDTQQMGTGTQGYMNHIPGVGLTRCYLRLSCSWVFFSQVLPYYTQD